MIVLDWSCPLFTEFVFFWVALADSIFNAIESGRVGVISFIFLLYFFVNDASIVFEREALIIVNREFDFEVRTQKLLLVVELWKIGMAKYFLYGESFVRVKLEHSVNEVQALFTGSWDHLGMAHSLDLPQQLENLLPRTHLQTFYLLLRRRPSPL